MTSIQSLVLKLVLCPATAVLIVISSSTPARAAFSLLDLLEQFGLDFFSGAAYDAVKSNLESEPGQAGDISPNALFKAGYGTYVAAATYAYVMDKGPDGKLTIQNPAGAIHCGVFASALRESRGRTCSLNGSGETKAGGFFRFFDTSGSALTDAPRHEARATNKAPILSTGKGDLTGEILAAGNFGVAFLERTWLLGEHAYERNVQPFQFLEVRERLDPAPLFKLVPFTSNLDSDYIDDVVSSPGDVLNFSLLLDRSHELYDFNGIDSISFNFNYDPSELALISPQLCAQGVCTISLPQPIYGGTSPFVIESFSFGVQKAVNDGLFDFNISNLLFEDEQSRIYTYSKHPLELQFEVQEVPAPPALLGLIGFFKYSRKLRRLAKR